MRMSLNGRRVRLCPDVFRLRWVGERSTLSRRDVMAEQRRHRFGRSLSERWRRSGTGEKVERIWMRLRQATLQGKKTTILSTPANSLVSQRREDFQRRDVLFLRGFPLLISNGSKFCRLRWNSFFIIYQKENRKIECVDGFFKVTREQGDRQKELVDSFLSGEFDLVG